MPQAPQPEKGWRPANGRLAPLKPSEARGFQRLLIFFINRIGGLDASNLFMMLVRNFRLFRSWLGFAAKLMPYGRIERLDTELVILRVGWNCRCRYEWGQHVDIGLRAGLDEATILRVPDGPDSDGWSDRQRALLYACDEIHQDREVSETTWAALNRHYNERDVIEVLMLIGHYEMLAGVLNSTGLPLDEKLESVLARLSS
ncbi:MAG: carboxymuconolactone decarboxylase family protein [Pseudomonadota bacterium]